MPIRKRKIRRQVGHEVAGVAGGDDGGDVGADFGGEVDVAGAGRLEHVQAGDRDIIDRAQAGQDGGARGAQAVAGDGELAVHQRAQRGQYLRRGAVEAGVHHAQRAGVGGEEVGVGFEIFAPLGAGDGEDGVAVAVDGVADDPVADAEDLVENAGLDRVVDGGGEQDCLIWGHDLRISVAR